MLAFASASAPRAPSITAPPPLATWSPRSPSAAVPSRSPPAALTRYVASVAVSGGRGGGRRRVLARAVLAPAPSSTSSLSLSADEARRAIEPAYDASDAQRLRSGDFTEPLSDADVRASLALSPSQTRFALTYGELTYEGATALGEILRLGRSDVFYDLGSGLGRAVLQAHAQWGVGVAVGVELSPERHRKAQRAKTRFARAHRDDALVDFDRPVAFLNENILECDLSDATCAYLCCACMDAAFVESVVEALRAKARGLRKMVVVERLETKFGTDVDAVGLRLAGEHRVGQTWAPEGYPLYVYETTEAWVR